MVKAKGFNQTKIKVNKMLVLNSKIETVINNVNKAKDEEIVETKLSTLADIYNALAVNVGETEIKKFSSKPNAVKRLRVVAAKAAELLVETKKTEPKKKRVGLTVTFDGVTKVYNTTRAADYNDAKEIVFNKAPSAAVMAWKAILKNESKITVLGA